MITLRRLLETKNPETLEKQDLLLKVFQENLDHADSYIYLAAIQVSNGLFRQSLNGTGNGNGNLISTSGFLDFMLSFHTAMRTGTGQEQRTYGLIRQNLCGTGTGTDTMPKYGTRLSSYISCSVKV